MSEEVYSSIPSLIDNLKKHTRNLENGKLPYESLEEMLDNARELYDRLVVLRFKAYEELVKKESQSSNVEEINREERKPSKQIGGMNFRFNLADQEIEEKKEEEQKIEVEKPKSAPKEPAKEFEMEESGSINDRLSKLYEDKSLVTKLQKTPIQDLKSAIGINQKFLFIQDLFNGDVEAYSLAIGRLNNFQNFREASQFLRNELASEYNWSTENNAVSDMLELVERRYS